MSQESFLIKRRPVGLSFDGGDNVCIFIPRKTILTLVDGPLDGKSMVNVKLGDSTAMLFAEDFKTHGKLFPTK
jgi:hypothetical protein